MNRVTIEVKDETVHVKHIRTGKKGRAHGKCYNFPIINDDTLAMPDLRSVPATVKQEIASRTQYGSFYNGEHPTPSQLNPDIDVVA